MKILITGGAGFIGSHLVRNAALGRYPMWRTAEITVLDNLTYAGNLANLAPAEAAFRFVRGDLCDADLLARIVPGHDVVVNFAAESHVDRSINSADEFVRTNVQGVQVLMQACLDAGVARVTQVSTDEVYGSTDSGSWAEDAPLSPNSPYAASKAGGDLIALAYARTHGLHVSVTRACNNYGPYQYPEKLIPLFVTNLIDGLKVPLYGDGKNRRQWIHVEDHCAAIYTVCCHGQPGEVYHVAGSAELSNIELTRAILESCGADDSMVQPVTDRKGHDRRYSLRDTKLAAAGFVPRVPFAEGLAETILWYKSNPWWWRPLKNGELAAPAVAAQGQPS